MGVGYDPTECREGTRLPESVCKSGTEVLGLEECTGGDFFVTTEKVLLKDARANPAVTQAALRLYLESGILVQRKSGSDFVQSIPHLSEIHRRMLEWVPAERCVLLITDLEFSREGFAIAGGRPSKWTLGSIRGKFRWWNLRGGWVDILSGDDEIGAWITEMYEILARAKESPVITTMPNHPIQKMVSEPDNWVTTGQMFPRGVGRKKRESLAREIDPTCDPIESPPSMGQVLLYTTSGRMKRAQGWGPTLLERMKEYSGVKGDRVIRDVPGFSEITIRFEGDQPVKIKGDGVKVSEVDGSIYYTFTEYSALENLVMVLSAMKEGKHGQ